MLSMHRQRTASREYLSAVLGRPPRWSESASQFHAFIGYLCDRVVSAFGQPVEFEWAPGHGAPFLELMKQDEPILIGTFHVGYSDLMGFFTSVFKKKIHMLRLRQSNSEDTERLEAFAGEHLNIIWVNEIENALFSLKSVVAEGGSVAMQCDRVQHASKLEYFEFLGAKRAFPFTIYWLSILFEVPVIFTMAGVRTNEHSRVPVHTSSIFRPRAGARRQNLDAARQHFQSVLKLLESLLNENPSIWFNFEPLNPIEKP